MTLNMRKSTCVQLAQACCEAANRGRASRCEEINDVVQDACVRALQLTRSAIVREPTRYVARIVRNALIDRGRRQKRELALFERRLQGELASRHDLDPERIITGEQALMQALAAIEALPSRCREAFELHRFEGLRYIAIAHHMGISTSMVEKHIAEAMLRVTRALAVGRHEQQVRSTTPRRSR